MAVSANRVGGAAVAGSGVFAMLLPFLSGGGYGAGLDLWLVLGGAVSATAGLLMLLLARRPAARSEEPDAPNAAGQGRPG